MPEDTSHGQEGVENREYGEKEGSANEQEGETQEDESQDDREEAGGGNQSGGYNHGKEENEESQDNREEQADQGDAKQDGGGQQDDREDRTDAENGEYSNNSLNSGASLSTQVPVEDQILPELKEAKSDSGSDSSSRSVLGNFPPILTSSPAPVSPDSTPYAVAFDQVSTSASQIKTPASSSTHVMSENDDGSLVALANLLGATIDPESLAFPSGTRAAASSDSIPNSNQTGNPPTSGNLLGIGSKFEPDTSEARLETEERGEIQ